ncbi:expressed unknown protein [Seminavis robusta]|uniref:Uncharacterized protein n=1 Tax=Seminavis robusta TaxID=568900 RepID=A0A9N8EYF9_9STRA|nr:expressed unknown protein [Seminavis robusta]|eukprot:Sro2095_g314230.1 n/a (457) ;mRNA; r:7631-9001
MNGDSSASGSSLLGGSDERNNKEKKSAVAKEEESATEEEEKPPSVAPARRIIKARRPQRSVATPPNPSCVNSKKEKPYDSTKESNGDWEAVSVTIEGHGKTKETEEEFYQLVLQMKAHHEHHLLPAAKNSRPHIAQMPDDKYKVLLQTSYLDYAVQFLQAWNVLGPPVGKRIIPLYAQLFVDNLEPRRSIRPEWLTKYVLASSNNNDSDAVKRFPPMQLFNALTQYPPANTKDAWEKIMKHPDTCWLRGIFLQDSWWGDPLVNNIVHSTQFNDKLVKLDLQSNKITDAGAKVLASCTNFQHLTHLNVFRNWIEEVPGVTVVAVSTSSVGGDFVHRSSKTSGEGGGLTALLGAGDKFPRLETLSIGYQSGCPMNAYVQSLESTMESSFPALTDLMIQCTVYENEEEYGWEPFIDSTFSHLKSGGKFPNFKAIHLQQCCNGNGEEDCRQSEDGVNIYL